MEKRLVGPDEAVVLVCGRCSKIISPGSFEYYFHREEEGMCSVKCYREYYASDEEVKNADQEKAG